MNKILIILFCFLGFTLNAQHGKKSCEGCDDTNFEINFKDSLANCADAINDLVDHPVDCDSFLVWYVDLGELGVNCELWEAAPDAVPHDNPSNIFTGSIGSGGLPTHPNAPSSTQVTADWNFSTSANQMKKHGYLDTRNLGVIDIRDNNQNAGERLWPFIASDCCTNPLPLEEVTVNTPASDRGYGYMATLPEGIHYIGWLSSDLSANQGVDIEYAPTGTEDYVNFPASRSFINKPQVLCKTVACDYVLQEGESRTKIELCNSPLPAIVGGGNPTDELQTLTAIGNATTGTTAIEISDGNTINIQHPPAPTLQEDRCSGFFARAGRDGWSNGAWQPVQTGNTGLITLDWDNVSAVRTAPSCDDVVDAIIDVKFGTVHAQNRYNRLYYYIDSRVLVNGVPVLTYNTQGRYGEDERTAATVENHPVQYHFGFGGAINYERLNIPSGATVQVQLRVRYQFISSQANSWGRVTGPLYPSASVQFHRRNQLEDVQLLTDQEYCWSFIDNANSLVYGKDIKQNIPDGATIYNSERECLEAIEKIESNVVERLKSFATKGLTKEQIKDLGLN